MREYRRQLERPINEQRDNDEPEQPDGRRDADNPGYFAGIGHR